MQFDVPAGTPFSEIKKEFFRRTLLFHPDTANGDKELFLKVSSAPPLPPAGCRLPPVARHARLNLGVYDRIWICTRNSRA